MDGGPGTAHEWEDVLRLTEETKKLWVQKDLLALINEMLCRKLVTGISAHS